MMQYTKDNPWIAEREIALCIWKVDQDRGFISNMNPSLYCDFMSYSNRQIAAYVQMIKACGFTGIQVTDICSAWRASLSYETVHDRFRFLADELHRNGMKFTVWAWAAEFTSHGWVDPRVRYTSTDADKAAYDDPDVFGPISEYYDVYAEMAPYADRVLAHFCDPGNIEDMDSVVRFAKLLFGKFKAKNPDIRFGIDTWGSPADFPDRLAFIDSKMFGVPFQGYDYYMDGKGGMKGVLAKLFTLFDQTGPEMDKACLITYLAEAFFLPEALLKDFITFKQVDEHTVEATITNKGVTASGVFHFNDSYEMISFTTNDRGQIAPDGSIEYTPWEAQCENYKEYSDGIKRPTVFRAIWKNKGGDFIYFDGMISRVNGAEVK